MDDINLLRLFSVPVYQTKLNNLTEEVKSSLKELQFQLMQDGSGHYSVEKYVLNLPEYKPLLEEVNYHVNKFVYDVLKIKKSIEFYLTTSWVVKHLTNNFANPHNHLNSMISGVMYFEQDPNFGNIVFENKTNNLFYKTLEIQFEEFNEINSDFYWISPKKDMLILFPSNLNHLITKNESKDIRYSLAFNYFVKGTLGVSTSVLDLK